VSSWGDHTLLLEEIKKQLMKKVVREINSGQPFSFSEGNKTNSIFSSLYAIEPHLLPYSIIIKIIRVRNLPQNVRF
jgi:hypothetical protein